MPASSRTLAVVVADGHHGPPRHRTRCAIASAAVGLLAFAGCGGQTDPAPPGDGDATARTSVVAPATGTSLVQPATGTSPPPPAALVDAACAGTLEVATVGRVEDGAGAELSGMAASRANPGVYWVHDDSGAGPEIHAIVEDGTLLATFELEADAVDWEDIAIAPGAGAGRADGWSLYVGDIGDNAEARATITLLRVPEPDVDPDAPAEDPVDPRPVDGQETVALRYPDRPHNAEALLVDPDTGQLVIVTKEATGPAQVFTADAEAIVDGVTVTLTPAGSVDVGDGGLASQVTGADVSPDGSVIVVRTYGGVHLFARTPDQAIADALATTACTGPPPVEVQGEAVAVTADGRAYLTVSEGEEPLVHRTG